MNVISSGSVGNLPMALPGVNQGVAPGSTSFNQVLQRFIEDTNNQQLKADQSVELLATGRADNVHDTMLTLTRADLSMRVFMEVRNKLIDAYQEVMKMQL